MHAYRQSPRTRRRVLHAGVGLAWALAAQALATEGPAVAPVGGTVAASPAGAFWTPLQEGARRGEVTVVLFSLQGCGLCEAVRREQLQPLARARLPGYRSVDLDLADARAFADARRHPERDASSQALARRLDVRVAPTLVFLGPAGEELAERLVGYGSRDFYGAYLEARIAQARERLAAPKR